MQGISAHGLLIEYQLTPGGSWTELGELGDTPAPDLHRNDHDITSHNRDIDTYIAGVLRRENVSFPVFFNKANADHTGLYTLIGGNTLTGWRMTEADGFEFVFSGFVSKINKSNPVDGPITANCTIRPSGPCIVDGAEFGA